MGNKQTERKEAAGIYDWMDRATKGLCDPLDRRRIKKELMAHYEDRCACYESTGLRYAEASKKAVAVLGSPEETGALLRSIHKPWLALALHLTRLLLLIGALLLALNLLRGNLSLKSLGFMSSTEQKQAMGLVPRDSENGKFKLLARREGHCSEEIDYGAFRVSLGDTAFAYIVRDNGDSNLYHNTLGTVLLYFRAAPWHELDERKLRNCLHVLDDRGEELASYYVRIRSDRIRPWLTGVFVELSHIYALYETKWLELRLEAEDESKALWIRFDDWNTENLDIPKLENEKEGVETASELLTDWENPCVVPPQRLSSRSMRPASTEDGKIQMSVPWGKQEHCLEDAENWEALYEKMKEEGRIPLSDSNEYARADCVLVFRGDPELVFPLSMTDLSNRLSLFRLTETGEREEIWYRYALSRRYADACIWALGWVAAPEAERYELCYTQKDGSVLRLELTLEEENRP